MKSVVFLQNVDVFSTFDEFSMGILLDAKCISDWTGSSNLTENEQYSHFQCDMQCINANTEWTVRVLEFFLYKNMHKTSTKSGIFAKSHCKNWHFTLWNRLCRSNGKDTGEQQDEEQVLQEINLCRQTHSLSDCENFVSDRSFHWTRSLVLSQKNRQIREFYSFNCNNICKGVLNQLKVVDLRL